MPARGARGRGVPWTDSVQPRAAPSSRRRLSCARRPPTAAINAFLRPARRREPSMASATARRCAMARYGGKSHEKVGEAMHEFKHGELKSSTGQKVKNPKQAIAIGLSEARSEGGKVPAKKSSAKSTGRKTAAKKSSAAKKSTARKSTAR